MYGLELTHHKKADTSPFSVQLAEACGCLRCEWDDAENDEVCTATPTCHRCGGRGIVPTYAGQQLLWFIAEFQGEG